jgi:hypothetical protein
MITDPQADLFDRESVLRQLDESMTTLEWAVSLVPDGWSHRSPTGRLSAEEGGWSVAMNLAHLALYEERFPTTVLESLLTGGDGVSDSSFPEPSPHEAAAVALAGAPLAEILERLRRARSKEAEIARKFTSAAWVAPTTKAWAATGLGPPIWSPARVLAKSFQHTWEHGNAVLRVALAAPRELLEI